MTKETAMSIAFGSLPSLGLNHFNRPMDYFEMKAEQGRLDMSQGYQRGLVWGVERKRNLIRSLRMGLPIGAIAVNSRVVIDFIDHPKDDPRKHAIAVIDGKQRISTLLEFMQDGFSVPASWWLERDVETVTEDGEVFWTGLTQAGQRHFTNIPLAVLEAQVPTLAEEKMIFDLINFGGVPQGESDL